MILKNKKNYKLFYVEPMSKHSCPLVCFTTGDVTKEWGDDWNDAPWEHNAGHPYYNQEDAEYFELRIQEDGLTKLVTPDEYYGIPNSPFSVQDINKKITPWLTVQVWDPDSRAYTVYDDLFYAGMDLDKFLKNCNTLGVQIWTKNRPNKAKRKSNGL